MNILYESLKEEGTMVIVPSTAVDSMNIGGLAGITAFAQQQMGMLPNGRTIVAPPPLPRSVESEAEHDLFREEETRKEKS